MTSAGARADGNTDSATETRRPGASAPFRRERCRFRVPKMPRATRAVAPTARSRAPLAIDPLDDRGDALSHADAHRRQTVATAGPGKLGDEHRDEAGPAHAEGVSERDGAPVDVDLGHVQAELADGGDRLAGEGLVELDEVEVSHLQPGPLDRLAGGRHRADAHD